MIISEIFEYLLSFKGKQYSLHRTGLPDTARDRIEILCQLFGDGPESQRAEIVSRVTREISYLFHMFAHRAALDAIRLNDKSKVVRGLEALAIENCGPDYRDSTVLLVLLGYSAARINSDPDELMRSIASIALDPAKEKLFLSYLKRSPDNRSLKKFYLEEAMDADGKLIFKSTYVPPPSRRK